LRVCFFRGGKNVGREKYRMFILIGYGKSPVMSRKKMTGHSGIDGRGLL